jgi:hypothetical protein
MKNITIIITLLIALQLSALDLSHWTQFSANYFSTDAENGIEIITSASVDADSISSTEKLGFKLQHETSGRINNNFSFSVQEDVFFTEKSHEQKNSFFYNDAKLKLYFQDQNHFVKFQYSNRFYEEENTLLLNSPSLLENIQQRIVHNTYFVYKTSIDKLDISLFSNVRNLDYNYARLEEEDDDTRDDDEEEWESHQAWDNDWTTNFVTGYQVSDAVRMFGKAYYKDDLNENDDFDHAQFGAGFEYDNRFDLFNSLFARFTYLNNNSKAIADYKEHYFLTEARYTKRFNNGFAGFISYINRSCFDKENSEFLRISNVVKMHIKYSYLIENTKDSFILVGIKYNPENEGNLILTEMNQHIIKNFYLGAGAKFAPDLYTQFAGKIEYLITPINSVWLKNEFTDFENKFGQNIMTIGTTLIF